MKRKIALFPYYILYLYHSDTNVFFCQHLDHKMHIGVCISIIPLGFHSTLHSHLKQAEFAPLNWALRKFPLKGSSMETQDLHLKTWLGPPDLLNAATVELWTSYEMENMESFFFWSLRIFCNRTVTTRIASFLNWGIPTLHFPTFNDLRQKSPFTAIRPTGERE